MYNMLKFRTDWSKKFSSSYGIFKIVDSVIGGKNISHPYEVTPHLEQLLDSYEKNLNINNKDTYPIKVINKNKLILFAQFHIKFEQIHPFLDDNGQMVLMKQCLENNIYSPIISANKNTRSKYYSHLKNSNSKDLVKRLLNSINDIKFQYDLYLKAPNKFINTNLITTENEINN